MTKVFPELADLKIDYFWSGTLGITFDENTHAGQIDGMWYSMCYVGHGVTLATYLGRQLANAILGRESHNPFANLNIPLMPVLRENSWMENIAKSWYRLLDMIP